MPLSTGFQTTQTNYTDALTIGPSQQIVQILFAVSSPYSATYEIAKLNKNQQPSFDGNELEGQPGNGGYQNCNGIRFKSYDPAHPTTVLAFGLFADDPTPLGFTPSSTVFNAQGKSSTGQGSVYIGVINADGTTRIGSTAIFASSHLATGRFEIDFVAGIFATPPAVVPATEGNDASTTSIESVSATQVIIRTYDPAGNLADRRFHFHAGVNPLV